MTSKASEHPTTLTTPSDLEIVITRDFDAPRSLVWEAWTKPEHVRRWYGLRSMTTTVIEIDLRPGGAWRWGQAEPNGQEVVFSGVYKEIVPPERLVYTEGFEQMPGSGETVVTLTFEEKDGRTTLTSTSVWPSMEVRDVAMASGMEWGVIETYARLDELLDELLGTTD
ncbi:SRPBCC family protein [Streptomyces sp. NPDC023998]|uniref:SRPBCC family protein n=1 Tax=Streptomyces sp. NPDC023998 TaxID=3154597 RepID=UPI0033FEADDB